MSLNRKPYKFEYIGGQSNAYVFETGNEVIYQIKFKPTPYLFSNHPNVGQNVFELVIEVIVGREKKYRQIHSYQLLSRLSVRISLSTKTVYCFISAKRRMPAIWPEYVSLMPGFVLLQSLIS